MIDELNKKFGLPGKAEFVAGAGGLPAIKVTTASADGLVYLHGGHIAEWQPAGHKPVLWMSEKSWFQDAKPIRGGVPICFPWFGPSNHVADAPGHGFVRLKCWQVESVRLNGNDSVTVSLRYDSTADDKKLWQQEFSLRLTVTFGAMLSMELAATNKSAEPMKITEALHTYFAVADVRNVSLTGLEGCEYIHTVGGARDFLRQDSSAITFTQETDRQYLDTEAACILHDPSLGRKIKIAKSGSRTTVVWNPWVEKSIRMPDYGDNEWPGMVCIETANADRNAVPIAPGKSHAMSAEISVEKAQC